MLAPLLQPVVQRLPSARTIDDPATYLADRLAETGLLGAIGPGDSVALALGSRGINCLAGMARALVRAVEDRGAKAFILPAMGSHGGASAEGQKAQLEHLGVSESACGAPVVSSMEVTNLGKSERYGIPLLVSADATRADHVIPLARVKSHTIYHGAIESGLLKMVVLGLGKEKGARLFHLYAQSLPYPECLVDLYSGIIARLGIPAGVAVVEDAAGRTVSIEVTGPGLFERTDRKLLARYRHLAPKLPLREADLLIVERLGKNISGSGMDTRVIGRVRHLGQKEPSRPKISRIWVRSLSPQSGGNALGAGLADFASAALVQAMNREATVTNALSSLSPEKARIPLVLEPERRCLEEALRTAGVLDAAQARVAWIMDTSSLERLLVSPALAGELPSRARLHPQGRPIKFKFDKQGNLDCFEEHWRRAIKKLNGFQ